MSGLIFILLASVSYSIKILGFEELRFDGALIINSTTLSIKTNNIVRMFINSDGNIGIGDSSPYNDLTVVGSVGVSGSLNASSINVTGNAYFATSSGNVGIGTTSPQYKLHVIGSANISDKIYSNVTYSLNAHPSYNPLDDELVLYLPFSRGNESNDATVFDRSKFGNDGVCYGVSSDYGCNWTTSMLGNALQFDGVDDYVNMSDNFDPLTNDLTISAWIKTSTDSSDQRYIVGKRSSVSSSGYEFVILSGNLRFDADDGSAGETATTSTGIINDNVFHHVVVVWDRGNTIKLYIDGSEDGSSVDGEATSSIDVDEDFTIGVSPRVAFYWNGTIDEVRIYKRALSEAEIRAQYLAGLNATLKPYVDSGGKVGINTSTPLETLSVNGTLLINPLGITALKVDSSGNVGIGTTTPLQTLVVVGTVNITDSLNVTNNIEAGGFFIGDGSLLTGISTGSTGPFNSSGTNVYLNDSTASVGIGTTTPVEKLSIIGNLSATGNATIRGDLTVGGDLLSLGLDGSAGSIGWIDDGAVVRLADATDKVGIGTSSPNYKLDVGGTINASGLHIDGYTNVTGTIFYGGNLTGYGADYAEMFEKLHASESIEAGDIVAIVKGKVTKTSADASLYMVVTDSAALIGNAGKGEIPVAFVGQVKTKVSGKVREGDYILANRSGVGYAKSKRDVNFEEFKSKVVGIALESKESQGVERINVVVGVK